MTALWFLAAALAVSAIGSLIIVLRHRQPSTEDWSVEEFRREMQALAPDTTRVHQEPRRAMPPPSRSSSRLPVAGDEPDREP
jgi:hypothetical protein